jgi:hypothetical protein
MTGRATVLDTADPEAVRAYERAFFDAFRRATSNRLVRKLWLWDMNTQRLSTRIPYADQLIYVVRDGAGAVRIGMAANLTMREFQSAAYGFTPPPGERVLEVLTFFSSAPRDLRGKKELCRVLFEDARARGYRAAVATTAERPLRTYLQTGWTLEAEAEIEGERRYFLRYELDPSRVLA